MTPGLVRLEDLLWRGDKPCLNIVDPVGFLADVGHPDHTKSPGLEDPGGGAAARVAAVWTVELVLGVESILVDHLAKRFRDCDVGVLGVAVGGDRVLGSRVAVEIAPSLA